MIRKSHSGIIISMVRVSMLLFLWQGVGYGQAKTDVSLFMKRRENVQMDSVASASGNLFNKLGHHGPAIENQWYGLRLYFHKKAAIDLYSKAKPGLELREKHWYPDKEEQRAGWGADYYKVGNTVGLGGIKLWDGKRVVDLHPVSRRSANVENGEGYAVMEMLSEGVSYKKEKVDIMVRVTVYDNRREAKVEACSMTGEPVQFVTGLNYFQGLEVLKGENYVATWGIHPEDVAAEKVEVGAGLVFSEATITEHLDDGKQYLYISKPLKHFAVMVTSCNAREGEMNSFESLLKEVKRLASMEQ
ncbi:MAG: DUF4861 family protein [Bacteroidales bacterium]